MVLAATSTLNFGMGASQRELLGEPGRGVNGSAALIAPATLGLFLAIGLPNA